MAGVASKHSRKGKCVIKRWRLERLVDDWIKVSYREVLRGEISGSRGSIQSKVGRGMAGSMKS